MQKVEVKSEREKQVEQKKKEENIKTVEKKKIILPK